MLSTAYRLRLERICNCIENGETVELNEIIWADKLANHNQVASKMMRQARRKATNPEMTEDSLDGFLNALDLGDPDPSNHKSQFNSPDDIANWFKRDSNDEWRKRD